jgi:hypothetical protein
MIAKEFKQKLDTIRQEVINMVTSTARCFETYEVAGELDTPVKFADGYDEQDEPQEAQEIELDGTIVIYHQGNVVQRLQPKDCSTEFLLDVLQEIENTLSELHKENFKS